MENVLSGDERERARRFHFAKDRQRWVAARASLRGILARYVNEAPDAMSFRANAYGKPTLGAASTKLCVHFNLSHSENLAVVAIASAPIGIDVEYVARRTNWRSLVSRVFSERELAIFAAAETDKQRRLFYQLWTRKEAYVKACGLGMSLPLQSFAVGIEDGAISYLTPDRGDRQPWYLFDVTTHPGYEAALACRFRSPAFRRFTWELPGR
jgi:4'-phosphopantetheinyl transferase